MQVQAAVEALAVNKPSVLKCPANSFPSHWAPQQSNTKLVEVDLESSEIAGLMAMIRLECSAKVFKVSDLCLHAANACLRFFLIMLACTIKVAENNVSIIMTETRIYSVQPPHSPHKIP